MLPKAFFTSVKNITTFCYLFLFLVGEYCHMQNNKCFAYHVQIHDARTPQIDNANDLILEQNQLN